MPKDKVRVPSAEDMDILLKNGLSASSAQALLGSLGRFGEEFYEAIQPIRSKTSLRREIEKDAREMFGIPVDIVDSEIVPQTATESMITKEVADRAMAKILSAMQEKMDRQIEELMLRPSPTFTTPLPYEPSRPRDTFYDPDWEPSAAKRLLYYGNVVNPPRGLIGRPIPEEAPKAKPPVAQSINPAFGEVRRRFEIEEDE